MKNLFVPYNESILLRNIEFDLECLATIDQTEFIHIKGTKNLPRGSMVYNTIECPLYAQAFEWFRVKHNISSYVRADWQPDWNAYSYQSYFNQDKEQLNLIKYYKTYEEAELACLQELIKIVSE